MKQKRYWLTELIQDPDAPEGSTTTKVHHLVTENHTKKQKIAQEKISRGEQPTEDDLSTIGEKVDLVSDGGRMGQPDRFRKKVIVMTYCEPETEALIEADGNKPLSRAVKRMGKFRSSIPLQDRFLLDNIKFHFPELPDGEQD